MRYFDTEILSSPPVVLTLKIENSRPIELRDFVGAFTSLAREFSLAARGNPDFEGEATIYVQQVRSGSTIADLIPILSPALPIIASNAEQIWQAVEFVKLWEKRIVALANGVVPDGCKRSELKVFADATAAIARDPSASSTLEAATFEDGKRKVRAAFTFNTAQARSVEKTIEAEFKRIDSPNHKEKFRVLMVFTRSDVNSVGKDKPTGERAVIDEVSPKALPVIYSSELAEQRVRHEIRDENDNIFKKGFVVDVMLQTRGEKLIAYKVTDVHDVIDIDED